MIVSHKYKFIFVKTRKTAGTSLEVTLSGYCGEEDIFTPIDPPEDGHQPRNFWIDEGAGLQFFNHMPAREIREHLGEDVWNNYYKFCFERHPYWKCVSLFRMIRAVTPGPKDHYTFEFWLKNGGPISDFDLYTDEAGEIIVDNIFRYKNLDDIFRTVCAGLGIPCEALEAQAKSGYEKVPVEITPDQRQWIQEFFHREFEHFGFPR